MSAPISLMGPLTGLSTKNATNHILGGETQMLMQELWNGYTLDCESLSTQQVESISSIVKVFSVINVDSENSYEATMKQSSLSVDMARCFIIYFAHVDVLSNLALCLSPSEMLNCFTCICAKTMEEVCVDKHMDILATTVPFLAAISRAEMSQRNESHTYSFLTLFITMLSRMSASYSSSKKLFILGTGNMLSSCLDMYCALSTSVDDAQQENKKQLLTAVDSLLSVALFDDVNNVKELSQIPLESIEAKKETSMEESESGIVAGKKKSNTKKKIFSYHAEFLFVVGKWVSSQSIALEASTDYSFAAGKATQRLLDLFIVASKACVDSQSDFKGGGKDKSGENASFVVRWRQHVKRLLHTGMSLAIVIKTACVDCAGDGERSGGHGKHDVLFLLAWSAVLDSMNAGLRGGSVGSGDDDMNSGSIPNHDSMTPYLDHMKKMGADVVRDVFNRENEGSASGEGGSDVLYAQVLFLGKLFSVNYRSMLDMLPSLIQIICKSCNDAGDTDQYDRCRNVTEMLLLQLLKLYTEIRNVDTFIRVLIVESLQFVWKANNLVEQFYYLLTKTSTQTILISSISSMPDGQRKLVWEAIYSASLSSNIITNHLSQNEINPEISHVADSPSPLRFFVLEAVLIPFVVAQDNQNHRPVPVFVLTAILKSVISDLKTAASDESLSDLLITASLQLVSALFQIAATRFSSSTFSPQITSYPYEMVYDQLPMHQADNKPSAAQEWSDFCVVAASLLKDGPDSESSPLKTIFDYLRNRLTEKSINNMNNCFVGATMASCMNAIFAAVSLFSACSDNMSPIAKYCRDGNQNGDLVILLEVHDKIQSIVLIDLLSLFSTNTPSGMSVLISFPFLCNLLMNEFSKWGVVVNDILQNEPTGTQLETLNSLFMALVQAAMSTSKARIGDMGMTGDMGTGSSLQAHIVDSLTCPDIEEIPFVTSIIVQSIGKIFENMIDRSDLFEVVNNQTKRQTRGKGKKMSNMQKENASNNFDVELLAFEMSLLQFPVKFLCNHWQSLCMSCCRVLHLVTSKHVKSSNTSQDNSTDALLASATLNILIDMTEVMLSLPEECLEFTASFLDMMVSGKTCGGTTLFVEQYSTFLGSFSSEEFSHKLSDPFNTLISVIFQSGFNHLLGGLVDDSDSVMETVNAKSDPVNKINKMLVGLLNGLRNSDEQSMVASDFSSGWVTFTDLVNILSTALLAKVQTDRDQDSSSVTHPDKPDNTSLRRALFAIIARCFGSLIQQNPLLVEWTTAENNAVVETFGKLEHLISTCLESLNHSLVEHSDEVFPLISNTFTLLVHISSAEKVIFTKVKDDVVRIPSVTMTADTDTSLVSVLMSGDVCVSHGWLHLLSVYLHGQSFLDSDNLKSYLSVQVVDTLASGVIRSIDNIMRDSMAVASHRQNGDYCPPSVVFKAIKSLLNATPPSSREQAIAKPLMHFVSEKIRMLAEKSLFVERGLREVFLVLFAATSSLLDFGNTEWREGTKSQLYNVKIIRNCYKKYVVDASCDIVLDICTLLLSVHHLEISSVDIYGGNWNCGALIDIMCTTLQSQLKIELQNQFEVSQLLRKRKRKDTNTRSVSEGCSDSVGRLFDTCFSFLCSAAAQLAYLSIQNSTEVQVLSVRNFKISASTLISLFTDVLSCATVPVINSYIGSIVLLFRHLLFITSSLISVTHNHSIPSVSKSGQEVMALLGRALMAVASSKHLQKHAYLIVSAVIDTISGLSNNTPSVVSFESSQSSTEGAVATTGNPLNFGEGNDLLREHLFPGIFALFDRCRSGRERKQIFASLRTVGGSRTLYTDLHTQYQQDFKFIGKA